MTLLEVSIKGVLKGSGAVKNYFFDVHSALFEDLLKLVVGQTIFGLRCNDFGC